MLFNSAHFVLLFLPITLTGFFIFGKLGWRRPSIAWLVAASMFFYGWFSVRYLAMLAVLILVNFWLGQRLARDFRNGKQRPYLVACGIAINLGVLGYFKYANFFIGNVNAAFGTTFVLRNVILPIGISFFTFQKIAYLVDAYRGDAEGYELLEFSLFVMFFPQLIAGPIVHHKEIIPQFRRSDLRLSFRDLAAGISLFVIGMVKKVLIADTVSDWANAAFSATKAGGPLSFFDAWSGALSFALQIYFDFSGYTDMALGLALMVGIRLPLNFNSPYKAHNIIDFWRRWHMTLSRFLRDYVYIPLGGNRRGRARRYLNLMLTMLLGGFWHGAAWTFVVWGGLHGAYLAINHAWQGGRGRLGWKLGFGPIGKLGGGLLTFLCVVIAWVFFRAEGFASAAAMLKAMAWSGDLGTVDARWVIIAALLALVWFLPNSQQLLGEWRPVIDEIHPAKLPAMLRSAASRLGFASSAGTLALTRSTGAIAGTLLFGLLVYQAMRSTTLQPFIYFQF